MRVLQIINSLHIGGAEKLIVDVAPRLKSKGIDCDVLLLQDTDSTFKQAVVDKGVNVFCVGAASSSVYDPRHILRIIPYLKDYDLAHVHLFPAQYWAAAAARMSCAKIPIVTTEHNTDNRRRHSILFRPFDYLAYKGYKQIIGISESVTKNQIAYMGMQDRTVTIQNGVDVSRFFGAIPCERSSFDLSARDFVVTMVGAFRVQKDQDSLIRALALLPDSAKLILVGDGVRKQSCMHLVDELGLSARVLFAGIRADIPEILKMSDAVVLSSHYEGFGLAAVEGMAACKPTIVSDVAGLAHIVSGAGLLFPKGDARALAHLLQSLMEDKSYAQEIADCCLQRAWDYDLAVMVRNLISLYKTVCHQ